ncbi:MAG TPA: hypothetical protein VF018_13405, partial [Acidobacteriaceae bacterium]
GCLVAVGEAAHALDEEDDDAHQDDCYEEQEYELGEVLLDKGERIAVPVAQHVGEMEIILRGEEGKEHYE